MSKQLVRELTIIYLVNKLRQAFAMYRNAENEVDRRQAACQFELADFQLRSVGVGDDPT